MFAKKLERKLPKYHRNIWEKIMMVMVHVALFTVGKTSEEGAQTAMHLATASEVENVTGKYFCDIFPVSPPEAVNDETLCEKIWEFSEEIVKLKPGERLV
ncbi:hypothetical protein JTB14_032839 [Gonioctena quinquepunctata]|nr:hypothetical protein JTB14_032839 [Gonioctena quinquepunctata]